MIYYVCEGDYGRPFKVELVSPHVKTGDRFISNGIRATLFEVIDRHDTKRGTQLQVEQIPVEALKGATVAR
jgi:hypothetical protein